MVAGFKKGQNLSRGLFQRIISGTRFLTCAILVCFFWSPAASAQQTQTTVTSAGSIPVNQSCNAGSVLVRNFVVGLGGPIADVNLGILIDHVSRNNLRIRLRSPSGTQATLFQNNAELGTRANLNAVFDDDAFDSQDFYDEDPAPLTPAPPPYHIALHPSVTNLSIFNGEDSLGFWQLEICDPESFSDPGTFLRADLYITRNSGSADLSLTKSVSNSSPLNGDVVSYTLAVNNSPSSTATADGVIVRDTLPAGLAYVGSSGFGSYDEIRGEWTIGSIPPGTTRTITIMVRVTAPAGKLIVNRAEIQTSSVPDPDSTPNNDAQGEDDLSSVSLSVAATPGTPPDLVNTTCRVAGVGSQLLDWNVNTWPSGATNYQVNIPRIGNIDFNLVASTGFATPVETNNVNTGGLSGQLSLHLNVFTAPPDGFTATIAMALPVAVPGLQFTLFDVDGLPDADNNPSTHTFDKITVTGLFNGNPVSPVLTNGAANRVSGNVAEGIIRSDPDSGAGNVVVTFTQPVDSITITFEELDTVTQSRRIVESISLHNIIFCEPVANINITKTSSVITDGISASNPKAIPGSIVQYCLLIENQGSATATNINANDPLPNQVSYVADSLRSGTDCADLTQIEDDDINDSGELDDITAGIDRGTVTIHVDSMPIGDRRAVAFNVRVND